MDKRDSKPILAEVFYYTFTLIKRAVKEPRHTPQLLSHSRREA